VSAIALIGVNRGGQRPFGGLVKLGCGVEASSEERLRHMIYIKLADPDQKASLCAFFTAPWGGARLTDDARLVAVTLPGASSQQRERAETAAYLRTWRALCGGCEAEIVDDQALDVAG